MITIIQSSNEEASNRYWPVFVCDHCKQVIGEEGDRASWYELFESPDTHWMA